MGRLLRWIVLLILVLLLLWLLQRCSQPGDAGGETEPPAPTNSAPLARNDDLTGCSLAAAGGRFACTFVAPAGTLFANNGHGADSDPDGDSFTAHSAGAIVVGGTGDPWSPPGPEARSCTADFLCTTDRNFHAAGSSLAIAPDGGFTLVYETNVQPFGSLIAEFLYEIEDPGGLTSDPGYVQVFISP